MKPRDYCAQATPQVISAAGWEFIMQVTDYARPGFDDKDFYPLKRNSDGSASPDAPNELVKVVLVEFPGREMIAYPYLDDEGHKMIYVQFADEDYLDSISVKDGQNKYETHKKA